MNSDVSNQMLELPGRWTRGDLGRVLGLERARMLRAPPPCLVLCISSIGCSSVSFITTCNKLLNEKEDSNNNNRETFCMIKSHLLAGNDPNILPPHPGKPVLHLQQEDIELLACYPSYTRSLKKGWWWWERWWWFLPSKKIKFILCEQLHHRGNVHRHRFNVQKSFCT